MKQLKMKFIPISTNLNEIRASLGIDRTHPRQKRHTALQRDDNVYHLDWQIVPYVPTQFPSLHRDVITLEEFAEGMAEVEAEEREREAEEDARRRGRGGREVVTDSESEEPEDASDAETRSEDESSDSEMDEFVVDDDHVDTDNEGEGEEEEQGADETDPLPNGKKPSKKDKLKTELKNLGLSSGQVGESFAVAKDGLGKRTRRQTDHLAARIFQAGGISREIDDYDAYNFETKKFKEEAYHKSGSTKSLWEKPKAPMLAITGPNAKWAKNAMKKRGAVFPSCASKKAKPGQRPCAAAARATDDMKKKKSDIRAYLVR